MVNIRPLNSALQKKAINEINEVPERIENDIEAFREWIRKSPHIKGREDDQFLLNFLRGCKFSLDKTKEKFDLFYTLKTHLSKLKECGDLSENEILSFIRQGAGIILPNLECPEGIRYVIFRPGAYDPAEFKIQSFMRILMMFMELLIKEDDNLAIVGRTVIIDYTGVTTSHLLQFDPSFLKILLPIMQDAYPGRLNAIHLVNIPPFWSTVTNISLSLMKEKNRKKVFNHGSDMKALWKVVPQKILAKEYGGEAGTIQELTEDMAKIFLENRDFFLESEKHGVDESKRVEKSRNFDSLFGVEGSFRQLNID